MTKPIERDKNAKAPAFKNNLRSWTFVLFVAYVVMAGFQNYVIFPVEAKLLPLYSTYASLLYLPHAVRVLATAIYGPKTFWVLLPAILVETYVFYPPINGQISFTILALIVIGAVCAPIGYVILKMISGVFPGGFDTIKTSLHWRYVFAAGIIASAINSIGLTVCFFELSDLSAASLAMLRFFIGDIIGLFVGLVILTWVFRLLRKIRQVES